MIRRAAILALMLAGSPVVAGVDPAALAQSAAAKLSEAQLSLNKAKSARDRVASLTQTIKAYEDGLEALREGMRQAAIRETATRRKLEAESANVSGLLGALLSIQSSSGPVQMLHPSGPLGTARAGIILSDVTPAFQAEVAGLRTALEEVALMRSLQESAAKTLEDGLQGIQEARTELSQAISNRTDLPPRIVSDPALMRNLLESAETLNGFATGLVEIETAQFPELADITEAKGTLPLPVAGEVLRRAGEADAAGIKRPGILIATRPLALVTTPWPATVRYRGPLLDYGNVMILEPRKDMLLVLAGLDEVYGEVGDVLDGGAPVGLMGGARSDSGAFLLKDIEGSGAERTETLYMEVRLGQEPVDPASWFAMNKE